YGRPFGSPEPLLLGGAPPREVADEIATVAAVDPRRRLGDHLLSRLDDHSAEPEAFVKGCREILATDVTARQADDSHCCSSARGSSNPCLQSVSALAASVAIGKFA